VPDRGFGAGFILISVINYRRSPTRYWRSAVTTDT